MSSYLTFSQIFYDDIDYDLIFGGKYLYDGESMTHGFTGYMLEIRLYSSVALTLT